MCSLAADGLACDLVPVLRPLCFFALLSFARLFMLAFPFLRRLLVDVDTEACLSLSFPFGRCFVLSLWSSQSSQPSSVANMFVVAPLLGGSEYLCSFVILFVC